MRRSCGFSSGLLLAAGLAAVAMSGCPGRSGEDVTGDMTLQDTVRDVMADLPADADPDTIPGDTAADMAATDVRDTVQPDDVVFTDASDVATTDVQDTGGDTWVPPSCCTTQEQCGDGHVCLNPLQETMGTCAAAPGPGRCFSDSDCYNTQECVGMVYCGCGMLCEEPTMPGNCSPLPMVCCNSDDDCDENFECKGAYTGDHLPGRCVAVHWGPACLGDQACCWDDTDCPGDSTCSGATVCGCIELCYVCGMCAPDQMGYCN